MHRICKLLFSATIFLLQNIILMICSMEYAIANDVDTKNKLHINGATLKANEISYDSKSDMIIAQGDVSAVVENYHIKSDHIHYNLANNDITAEGNVSLLDISSQDNKIIYGSRAIFKNKLRDGLIQQFMYNFDKNSVIRAKLARRINKKYLSLDDTSFTPCLMSCGNQPLWQLRAAQADVDFNQHKIVYKNIFFELYGVPVAYLPYLTHPVPNSPAQSGILAPKIKKDSIAIPFYWRIKPNYDLTITPRYAKKYMIFEGEFRHQTTLGQYKMNASYSNIKQEQNNPRKNAFYLFATGDFDSNNTRYGFDLRHASDKAYLTNVYSQYDSYLISKIYADIVNRSNYLNIEGLSFQNLNKIYYGNNLKSYDQRIISNYYFNDSVNDDPIIFPKIRTQNIATLNDNESLLLNFYTNILAYQVDKKQRLFRASLNIAIKSNFVSPKGHVFVMTLSNRGDVYITNMMHKRNIGNIVYATNDLNDNSTGSKNDRFGQRGSMYKNIPELKLEWKYPLIRSIGASSMLYIEPIAMIVFGKKYDKSLRKFILIDEPYNEISVNNFFNSNKFNGIDFHNYGTSLNHGIKLSGLLSSVYTEGFVGQSIQLNNDIIDNSSHYRMFSTRNDDTQYAGHILLETNNDIVPKVRGYYSFARDQSFKSTMDEFGCGISSDDLNVHAVSSTMHLSLNNFNTMNYYYHKLSQISEKNDLPDDILRRNKISQLIFDLNYQVIDGLWFGLSSAIDTTYSKNKILNQSINVTYLMDCVSMSASISRSFLSNTMLNITRDAKYAPSFSIRLKAINW